MNFEQDNFLHGQYAVLGQDDGDVFIYDQEGPRLLLNRVQSTAREIDEVRSEPLEFALYLYGQVLFLLYRFGKGGWSDAPFSLQLNAPEHRGLCEEFGKGDHYALMLQLRCHETNRVVVNRLLKLTAEFSHDMHQMIAHQLFRPLTYTAFRGLRNLAYQEFPEPSDMAAKACVRCIATD